MNNIFEDARFGDRFVTYEGTFLIYICCDENNVFLLEQGLDPNGWGDHIWTYNFDGTIPDIDSAAFIESKYPRRKMSDDLMEISGKSELSEEDHHLIRCAAGIIAEDWRQKEYAYDRGYEDGFYDGMNRNDNL